jgi:flagellar biogenesis protein FliO
VRPLAPAQTRSVAEKPGPRSTRWARVVLETIALLAIGLAALWLLR